MAPRTMLGHKGGRSDIAPGYIDGVRKQAPGRRCVKPAFTLNGGASDSVRDETASDARWPVQAIVIAKQRGNCLGSNLGSGRVTVEPPVQEPSAGRST